MPVRFDGYETDVGYGKHMNTDARTWPGFDEPRMPRLSRKSCGEPKHSHRLPGCCGESGRPLAMKSFPVRSWTPPGAGTGTPGIPRPTMPVGDRGPGCRDRIPTTLFPTRHPDRRPIRTMDHSRRKFLAAASRSCRYPPLSLSGCLAPKAAPHGHRSSYTSQILQPGNANTVFHWTDVALQQVRDQRVLTPRAAYNYGLGMAASLASPVSNGK